MDERALRRVFGRFPTGVVSICALDDGQPIGIAASSFTSVSIEPPLVSICVGTSSTTWPRLRKQPRLGLSVLARGQDTTCRALADRGGNRFAGSGWTAGPRGAVLIDGAAAWLECSLHAELSGGDHSIALLRVHGHSTRAGVEPLVFHDSRFRELAQDGRGAPA